MRAYAQGEPQGHAPISFLAHLAVSGHTQRIDLACQSRARLNDSGDTERVLHVAYGIMINEGNEVRSCNVDLALLDTDDRLRFVHT